MPPLPAAPVQHGASQHRLHAKSISAGMATVFAVAGAASRCRAPRRVCRKAESDEPVATEAAASRGGRISAEEREARQNDDIFANDGVPEGVVFDPKAQVGITAPLGFFDPLGFCNDIDRESFRRYRSAELKHGRVAMLASVGAVFAHFVRFPFMGVDEVPRGFYENVFRQPVSYGWDVLLLLTLFTELGWWEEVDDREPGDFGDPLNIGMYTEEMRNRELNNGRFAMFAAAGILFAEYFTGKDAVEQFGF